MASKALLLSLSRAQALITFLYFLSDFHHILIRTLKEFFFAVIVPPARTGLQGNLFSKQLLFLPHTDSPGVSGSATPSCPAVTPFPAIPHHLNSPASPHTCSHSPSSALCKQYIYWPISTHSCLLCFPALFSACLTPFWISLSSLICLSGVFDHE